MIKTIVVSLNLGYSALLKYHFFVLGKKRRAIKFSRKSKPFHPTGVLLHLAGKKTCKNPKN